MRHEICHKKSLLNGSNGKFRMRTPPFDNESFQEAGSTFDKIAFEMINPNKSFAISGITHNIARIILFQETLIVEEVNQIFVASSTQEKRYSSSKC